MLIDTHCHLDLLPEETHQYTISDAAQLGIKKMIIPGLEPLQWQKIRLLAEQHESLYFTIGLHPWWIKKQKTSLEETISILQQDIPKLLDHPKCVAIGECGLDGLIDIPIETQLIVLNTQLHIAAVHHKPVVLHSRKTHHILLQQLKRTRTLQHTQKNHPRGVIHGFSGHIDQANAFIQQGLLLGIGGTITYDRAKKSRQTVQSVALSSLVLETDTPDMPLYGFQGQANNPSQTYKVAECLAELRQEPLEVITQTTTHNALSLFKLPM